jgi:hypothetical protein
VTLPESIVSRVANERDATERRYIKEDGERDEQPHDVAELGEWVRW